MKSDEQLAEKVKAELHKFYHKAGLELVDSINSLSFHKRFIFAMKIIAGKA